MFKLILFTTLLSYTYGGLLPRLDGRIVGGQDTDIGSYPYQLSLQYYGSHICGASIISKTHVITAAHCTHGSTTLDAFTLIAGIGNLDETSDQILKIAQIFEHPDFSSNYDYDISVLELQKRKVEQEYEEIEVDPIEYNESVQPVELPQEGTDPIDGTEVVCTGWGATSEGGSGSKQLQAVELTIVGREDCREQYGFSAITQQMICAGVPRGGKDACQGDSGGPLVADGQLVGIVSWGVGCARPDFSGVYSNVGALRSFIDQNAKFDPVEDEFRGKSQTV